MLICLRCCTLFCPKCLRCSANYCFVIWTCRKGMKIYQFWGKGQPKNESIGAQTTQDVAFHEIRFHLSNGLSFLFDIITTNVKSKLFPGVATRSITQQAVGVSWCMVRTCYLARHRHVWHVWSKTWNAMNEKCFVGNCDLEVLTLCSSLVARACRWVPTLRSGRCEFGFWAVSGSKKASRSLTQPATNGLWGP